MREKKRERGGDTEKGRQGKPKREREKKNPDKNNKI